MRHRATISALSLGFLLLTLLASSADADVFGPISLVSLRPTQQPGVPREQANFADQPALSGDARYVAFRASFGGVTGLWRRDLQTDAVEPVALGDAQLPSISAEGRYVSFTTTEPLVPGDNNKRPDVYVRDMEVEPGSAHPCTPEHLCPFTLASAVDESEEGLTYNAAEPEALGSRAAGRSALSADGRHVAFVTTAVSNLANPRRPAAHQGFEAPETPALQVAVRDLDTKRTRLVSVLADPTTGLPEVNATTGQEQPVPTEIEGKLTGAVLNIEGTFPPSVGASLSADGSTVAWIGQQIGKQARVLTATESLAEYTEPLWRRIGDGPQAPTRRITGGSDLANPTCAASGETDLTFPPTLADPCQGPFDAQSTYSEVKGIRASVGGYLPRLSADGETVAFLASARYIPGGEEFASGTAGRSNDVYVVDMGDGLTRVQSLRRLTEIASGSFATEAANAPIADLGISPDGTEIAFSTLRIVFSLGSPAYVSTPSGATGAQELYDVDLANDTLTRVMQGFDGQRSEPIGALTDAPSFSADGATLAFSSTADNLLYGDGNKASDIFVVARRGFATEPTPQYISPAPSSPLSGPDWRLDVSASSRPDGSVLLEVTVPGAGSLRASAKGAVLTGSARASRRARRGKAGRKRAGRTVATRTVATAGAVARADGAALMMLTLKLAGPYRALAAGRGGLSALLSVVFTAPGHGALSHSIPVTFLRRARSHRSSRSHARRAAKKGGHAR